MSRCPVDLDVRDRYRFLVKLFSFVVHKVKEVLRGMRPLVVEGSDSRLAIGTYYDTCINWEA